MLTERRDHGNTIYMSKPYQPLCTNLKVLMLSLFYYTSGAISIQNRQIFLSFNVYISRIESTLNITNVPKHYRKEVTAMVAKMVRQFIALGAVIALGISILAFGFGTAPLSVQVFRDNFASQSELVK